LSLVAGLFLMAGPAHAQIQLVRQVIGSGATNGSSTNYTLRGTVGQAVIGTGSSTSYGVGHGFWYTLQGGAAGVVLDGLVVYLEGAYDSAQDTMTANLLSSIPTSHPYSGPPWNCGSGDSVPTTDTSPANGIPDFFDANDDVIDWVLVELRTGDPPTTVVACKAGLLRGDGSVIDVSGSEAMTFAGVPSGSYYIVAEHRNHASAMTAALTDPAGGFDFTLDDTAVFGADPQKPVGSKFALYAADNNADKQIQALDFNAYIAQTTSGASGYQTADHNLDGAVQALDFNLYLSNTLAGAQSQVP
jgi:hypothetical protein